ncbi:uncharacterized protein LOC129790777 [Lutzomyia longipalpis]|uniref:uncharacterized protein LOC129790777 n=1 Tax=Lutzomyia longipalpis TaxID=7200 RepID=UPI0024841F35|nr:uncharacterized protein LOC129790777 [Lutzomyia longipalpis]
MSQNVPATRTSSNSCSSIVITAHFLVVAQFILGLLLIGTYWYSANQYKRYGEISPASLAFIAIPVTFVIGNFCILFGSLISFNSGGILFRTTHDLIYNTVALIAYLSATIAFFSQFITTISSTEPVYNGYMTASIIGFFVSGFYFISTYFVFKFHRIC